MDSTTRDSAVEAVRRGFQVIPIRPREKRPIVASWGSIRWEPDVTPGQVEAQFEAWHAPDDVGIGVLLGDASGRLLDVDLDHHKTARLKEHFLPKTAARSGRAGKPNSHYWYVAEEGTVGGTRQFQMPKDGSGKQGAMIVELRSNGGQTVIPPSTHPSGESYAWHGEPWGGAAGPAVVNGRRLATQVALLALGTVLLDAWPKEGGRHEAYLALAGGLLRDGDAVHPYWERNVSVLIRALAQATLDDDGPDSREQETVGSTIRAIRDGKAVLGFGKLAEIIGDEHVSSVRLLVGEVEREAGVLSRQVANVPTGAGSGGTVITIENDARQRDERVGATDADDRDPLEERLGSWEPVDLEPYLSGRVTPVAPTLLLRDDGQALMYPGRVNMLYGSSESAKSWIALQTCIQVMEREAGNRVLYIDFEDEPVNTLNRLKLLGAPLEHLQKRFWYIRPESPLAAMQRDRWGNDKPTDEGRKNRDLLKLAIDQIEPDLIVADGMTVLYGLHGLDTNDAVSTDIITGWLKSLTNNGKTGVIIIDHTTKGAEKGSLPLGSQHKQAMVQGSMLQVWMLTQPMPGSVGTVELVVLKDRPGEVRKVSVQSGTKAQTSALVTLDSTDPARSVMTIGAPLTQQQQNAQRSKQAEEAARREKEQTRVLDLFGGDADVWLGMMEILKGIGVMPQDMQTLGEFERRREDRKMKDYWRGVVDRLAGEGDHALDPAWLEHNGGTKNKAWHLVLGDDSKDASAVTFDLSNQP